MNKKRICVIITTITFLLILGIIFYDNEKIFNPGSGNIDTDKDFVDNQIIVYFNDGVSFNKIKKMVKKMDGTIDGDGIDIINSYTITLDRTFETADEIEDFCNILMNEYDIVEDCVVNEIFYNYFEPIID